MCGRFVSATPPDELATYFGAALATEASDLASYNVAPTNDVHAVIEDGGRRVMDAFFWGLVPHWADDPRIGAKMINARAETLAEKSAFKPSFARRRCIIPADGFYEWTRVQGQDAKQPYYVTRRDGEPLALAGLWSVWHGGDRGSGSASAALRSATIVTTKANAAVRRVHDRMPVLLPASVWDTWLDPDNDDLDQLSALLVPAPDDLLVLRPVSTAVNNVRNQGADLLDPPAEQLPLDLER